MIRTAIFLSLFICILPKQMQGAEVRYESIDSIRVVQWLREANRRGIPKGNVLFFARKLKGIPYVSGTLESNGKELLTVNLRAMDCTTYVETVLALTLCHNRGENTFNGFMKKLAQIRYEAGQVDYAHRLHYFSQWIAYNTKNGIVQCIETSQPPFSEKQTLLLNFMTTHSNRYPAMLRIPGAQETVKHVEATLTGTSYRYIPKARIADIKLMKNVVKDGDIIAITTNKKGLDVSHLGIAVWHRNTLHLLNASLERKCVVEEPQPLYQYLKRHASQTGIRIIRIR